MGNYFSGAWSDFEPEHRLDYIYADDTNFPTQWDVGDELSLQGLTVYAHYTDGSIEDISEDCSYNPATGDILDTVGEVIIDIEYDDGTEIYTTTQTISVVDVYPEWNVISSGILSFDPDNHSNELSYKVVENVGGGPLQTGVWFEANEFDRNTRKVDFGPLDTNNWWLDEDMSEIISTIETMYSTDAREAYSVVYSPEDVANNIDAYFGNIVWSTDDV